MNLKKANLSSVEAACRSASVTPGPNADGLSPETLAQRVRRLHENADGAVLIAWMLDEAKLRGMKLPELARQLGVTGGYINQLRIGIRKTSEIAHEFASRCADFLGVPTVVALVVAGYLTPLDFAWKAGPNGQACEKGEGARTLLDSEATAHEVLKWHELPEMVRWLQRSALLHGENELEAARGHGDASSRCG